MAVTITTNGAIIIFLRKTFAIIEPNIATNGSHQCIKNPNINIAVIPVAPIIDVIWKVI